MTHIHSNQAAAPSFPSLMPNSSRSYVSPTFAPLKKPVPIGFQNVPASPRQVMRSYQSKSYVPEKRNDVSSHPLDAPTYPGISIIQPESTPQHQSSLPLDPRSYSAGPGASSSLSVPEPNQTILQNSSNHSNSNNRITSSPVISSNNILRNPGYTGHPSASSSSPAPRPIKSIISNSAYPHQKEVLLQLSDEKLQRSITQLPERRLSDPLESLQRDNSPQTKFSKEYYEDRRPTDPFFYPTTICPLTDLGIRAIEKSVPKGRTGSPIRTLADQYTDNGPCFVSAPLQNFVEGDQMVKIQQQNDNLSKQVQALEHAKSLAAAQNCQNAYQISQRNEQLRREAQLAISRSRELQDEPPNNIKLGCDVSSPFDNISNNNLDASTPLQELDWPNPDPLGHENVSQSPLDDYRNRMYTGTPLTQSALLPPAVSPLQTTNASFHSAALPSHGLLRDQRDQHQMSGRTLPQGTPITNPPLSPYSQGTTTNGQPYGSGMPPLSQSNSYTPPPLSQSNSYAPPPTGSGYQKDSYQNLFDETQFKNPFIPSMIGSSPNLAPRPITDLDPINELLAPLSPDDIEKRAAQYLQSHHSQGDLINDQRDARDFIVHQQSSRFGDEDRSSRSRNINGSEMEENESSRLIPSEMQLPEEDPNSVEIDNAIETWNKSTQSVLSNKQDLRELEKLKNPQDVVKVVLKSSLCILGLYSGDSSKGKDLSWPQLRKAVLERGFMEKLKVLKLKQVTKGQFGRLRAYLERDDFDEELIKTHCMPVVPLSTWSRAVGYALSLAIYPDGPDVRPPASAMGPCYISGSMTPRPVPIVTPDLDFLTEEELRNVSELTVSRPDVAAITFHGLTDCSNLHVPSVVKLDIGEVLVYPQADRKPPPGEGLNKRATVTMYQCWPPSGKDMALDIRGQEKYRKKIQHMTEKKNAKFIDYDCETGIWKFQVEHF